MRFDRLAVTSDTWETYPILRFSEVPAVDVEFLPGGDNPPLGVGECPQGPTAAASPTRWRTRWEFAYAPFR